MHDEIKLDDEMENMSINSKVTCDHCLPCLDTMYLFVV